MALFSYGVGTLGTPPLALVIDFFKVDGVLGKPLLSFSPVPAFQASLAVKCRSAVVRSAVIVPKCRRNSKAGYDLSAVKVPPAPSSLSLDLSGPSRAAQSAVKISSTIRFASGSKCGPCHNHFVLSAVSKRRHRIFSQAAALPMLRPKRNFKLAQRSLRQRSRQPRQGRPGGPRPARFLF